MIFCIKLFYLILTMEALIAIRSIAIIVSVVLSLILCKFSNMKTILVSMVVVRACIILGMLVFLNGVIEGWAMLTFLIPFFTASVITITVYYVVKWFKKLQRDK